MQTVHVINLEKYHPNYKDRELIWCKLYFTLLNGDPEFELLCEIDRWRFIAFVMLELQIKKPIPLDPAYLNRKGFDLKTRPIDFTMQMLHGFVEVCNDGVTHYPLRREENIKKRREEKNIRASVTSFEAFWNAYPKKRSKGQAEKAWAKIGPDEQLHGRILNALEQAKVSVDWLKDGGRFIPYPASWLNAKGWEDEMTAGPKDIVDEIIQETISERRVSGGRR